MDGLLDITVDDDNVWMVSSKSVFKYKMKDKNGALVALFGGLVDGRGITYGDRCIFVTDHDNGMVYKFNDNEIYESDTDAWVQVEGAYGVQAINDGDNYAYGLVASLLLIVLS